MLKLRLRCARVKVDKRYKVTSGGPQTCSVANIRAQLCVLWCLFFSRGIDCAKSFFVSGLLAHLNKGQSIKPRVSVSNPMWVSWNLHLENWSYENTKALSPFYHKKYFWQKMNTRHFLGVLHYFLSKIIFMIKST